MTTASDNFLSISLVGFCFFIVNQFFTDLLTIHSGASLARLDEQRTTIQNHITDTTAHAQFNLFMQTYFIELAKRKSDFVLHYLPLATTEGQKEYAMPTVAPTDFMFQNIPFIVSDTDKGKPSDDNMLVYLQMTGNEPLPRELLATSVHDFTFESFLLCVNPNFLLYDLIFLLGQLGRTHPRQH